MQQGKGVALPVQFRATNQHKPHMAIKLNSLRILLVHIQFIRTELFNCVSQQHFSRAFSPARIVNEQHFHAIIVHTHKAVNHAQRIASNKDV